MSYLDDLARHALDFDQYSRGEQSIIAGVIRGLFDEAIVALRGLGLEDLIGQPVTSAGGRLGAIIAQALAQFGEAFDRMGVDVAARLAIMGAWERDWMVTAINDALGVSLMVPLLTDTEIAIMTSAQLIEGQIAADWWAQQGARTQARLAQEIRLGMVRGETMPQIVRRIRGTSTGRRTRYFLADGSTRWATEFTGGVLGITTRNAEAVVLTSAAQANADVNRRMLNEHLDAFSGVKQVSTLDMRTTPLCRQYDGKKFNLPDYSPDGHSLPYAGGVPRHWRCRSIETAIIRTDEDMLARGVDPNRIPGSTRASMFGQVPADWDWYDWFEGQPASFHRETLGKKAFAAFEDGKLSAHDAIKTTKPKLLGAPQ